MKIYPHNKENIKRAAEIICRGGLVAFPTETVYGLGANALDAVAAARIFKAKKRPFFDPLISHIADIAMLREIVSSPSDTAVKLAEAFWPGPLTLVLPKTEKLPGIVTSGLDTAAVRMPAHPVAIELIQRAGVPVAAPSANLFGALSPTLPEHVAESLGEEIDMILDGGRCSVGVESTIIKIEEDRLILLRPGGLPLEEIEKISGKKIEKPDKSTLIAPGMLPYHYAPEKPLRILASSEDMDFSDSETAFLLFKKPKKALPKSPMPSIEILSPSGDLTEAAANFFSVLHRINKSPAKRIFAEDIPREGLGIALADRLHKAAKKYKDLWKN